MPHKGHPGERQAPKTSGLQPPSPASARPRGLQEAQRRPDTQAHSAQGPDLTAEAQRLISEPQPEEPGLVGRSPGTGR